ncbi:conserved hypothetical protein [Ricinus communis]|uniref:Uncharacterized protein n=1 Tax=Ricinus communis TaxID=3988 RepID=B9SRP8_RICCO|nr:conserved hypothetical protein [Ricinus communis]
MDTFINLLMDLHISSKDSNRKKGSRKGLHVNRTNLIKPTSCLHIYLGQQALDSWHTLPINYRQDYEKFNLNYM